MCSPSGPGERFSAGTPSSKSQVQLRAQKPQQAWSPSLQRPAMDPETGIMDSEGRRVRVGRPRET